MSSQLPPAKARVDCFVTGPVSGYDPHGAILPSNRDEFPEERLLLQEVVRAAVLCNDASLEQRNNSYVRDFLFIQFSLHHSLSI